MIDIAAIRKDLARTELADVFAGPAAALYLIRGHVLALLAEAERNTCVCGHTLADHSLSTGAIVQCRICRDPESDNYPKDCMDDELTANAERTKR
jgi:hypothetical protein